MSARKTAKRPPKKAPRKATPARKKAPTKVTARSAPPKDTAQVTRPPTRPSAKARRKPPTPSPGSCMSADQFRNEISRRGWAMKQVAVRWGMGVNWLYKLAANEERGARWDDAVRGLPQLASEL